MKEIFRYISKDLYEDKVKQIENNQTLILYKSNDLKIKLKKANNKCYTIIVRYGEEDISDIAKRILINGQLWFL